VAKVIRCACGFVVRGATDDELLTAAQSHIRTDHPEMIGKVAPEDLLAMAEEV
jgi:predicted small metal-binding protein